MSEFIDVSYAFPTIAGLYDVKLKNGRVVEARYRPDDERPFAPTGRSKYAETGYEAGTVVAWKPKYKTGSETVYESVNEERRSIAFN